MLPYNDHTLRKIKVTCKLQNCKSCKSVSFVLLKDLIFNIKDSFNIGALSSRIHKGILASPRKIIHIHCSFVLGMLWLGNDVSFLLCE